MKIGIIKEGKTPPDSRVPLTPHQCAQLIKEGHDIVVQPSDVRSYSNQEYSSLGVPMSEDLSDRDVLLGVKEVPIDMLIPEKKYFFFSHTIKEQPYNRDLLQAVMQKNIELYDYEVLTNDKGQRVIAFGKFAGMVGAHNALYTYGERTKEFSLPRMKDLTSYNDMKDVYKRTSFTPTRVVLTGTGRVSSGARMVLEDMGMKMVSPLDYATNNFDFPVFTQLNSFFYAKRKDGQVFDDVQHFYDNPKDYESDFQHFLPCSDIMINGIYWDNDAPVFFTLEDMRSPDFSLQVIADVTCDIAPISSIPSTIKASTIADPIFGYDPFSESEVPAHQEGAVDMMTIDNLPNELPRDASEAFGGMFIEHVLGDLLEGGNVSEGAKMTSSEGKLTPKFSYLQNYVDGK